MHEAPVEPIDPPLTRRELRRREQEAAHATEAAPEVSRQQRPPGINPQPAAESTAPRRSPSGRTPQWAIDEAAGNPSQVSGWRGAPAPAAYDWETAHSGSAYVPPKVRRPSRVKRIIKALGRTIRDIFDSLWSLTKLIVLTTLTVVALWNVLAHLAPGFTADAGRKLAAYGIANPYAKALPGFQPPASSGTGSPPPGVEASDRPLGVPAPFAARSDSYAFLQAGIDQPFVSYDPCRPIHYVIRPDNAPAGGEQAIHESVAAVSRATGFMFINDGTTSEPPSDGRPAYQPERYGDRWAPVLFAWETPIEQPQFTENWSSGSRTTLGLGGSATVTSGDQTSAYVTGQVRLNSAALGTISEREDGHTRVKSVIQHELAHVVGLGHIADPTQLMTATMTDQVTDFAAGDLTGLAMLGQGKCRPSV